MMVMSPLMVYGGQWPEIRRPQSQPAPPPPIGSPRTALWSGKADGGCWQGYYYYCYYCFATITFAIATFTIASIGTIASLLLLLILLWDHSRWLQECAMERSQLYPTCRLYTAYTLQITTTLTANSAKLHDRFTSKWIHLILKTLWFRFWCNHVAKLEGTYWVIWMQH